MQILLTTLAALLVLISAAAADVTLTVAPGPAGAGQYAGLAEARDAIRQMNQQGGLPGPVHVVVKGGVYHITEPIVFTPEDSGTAGAPIFYEAAPGERPVISGGRAIAGWRQEDAFWVADVPAPAPPSPTLISDDFESTPAGTGAAGATTSEEAPASIRVMAEAAVSGKQSLKFQDAPGLQHAYDPHL